MGAVGASAFSFAISRTLEPWPLLWLPSGVAFAVMLAWGWRGLPAVFAGTALAVWVEMVRFSTTWDTGELSLAVGGSALGTVLGPWMGGGLIQRHRNWQERLVTEREAVRFYLWSSLPVGVIGVLPWALAWNRVGLIPESSLVLFACLQALAQAMGAVLLGTILYFTTRPLGSSRASSPARIVIPFLVALAAGSILLWYMGRATVGEVRSEFGAVVSNAASQFERSEAKHLERLKSVRSLWDSSNEVEAKEFAIFVEGALERGEGLEVMGWIPEIPVEKSELLEEWLREQLGREVVFSPAEQSTTVPSQDSADDREPVFYPVIYVEPEEKWGDSVGYDLQQSQEVLDLLRRARGTEAPWSSGLVDVRGQSCLVLVIWIDRSPAPAGEEREAWIHDRPGFALSLLGSQEWVWSVLDVDGMPVADQIRLTLWDCGIQGEEEGAAARSPQRSIIYQDAIESFTRLPRASNTRSFAFAGRLLEMEVTAKDPLVASGHLWAVVPAQGTTLLMSGLLGILLLSSAGRTQRVENEVEERTRELAEAEGRFRQMADNIVEAFWLTTPDGKEVEYLSLGVERIWGRPWRNLLGSSRRWRKAIHPDDRERVEEVFRSGRAKEEGFDLEYRIRRPDGTERWIRDRGFPVKDDTGEVIRIAGVADDTTAQRRMEDELKRSNEDLEQFAYVASHDLQEPLRMVTSFVQLLRKRYGDQVGEEGLVYMDHAVSGAERMRRLILGLLEWSRVERKGRPMQSIRADLALDDAMKNLAVSLEESGAAIEREELPTVLADREQLARLFQNLIGNALRFCRDEEPKLKIGAKRANGCWTFRVEDNGEGIPEEQRERVFEVFQRLHTHSDVEGTGIGLAVCRKIAERHQGRIWVEDGSEGGACFCFTLPAVEEGKASESSPREKENQTEDIKLG